MRGYFTDRNLVRQFRTVSTIADAPAFQGVELGYVELLVGGGILDATHVSDSCLSASAGTYPNVTVRDCDFSTLDNEISLKTWWRIQ
jgi:hypothetical protein